VLQVIALSEGLTRTAARAAHALSAPMNERNTNGDAIDLARSCREVPDPLLGQRYRVHSGQRGKSYVFAGVEAGLQTLADSWFSTV